MRASVSQFFAVFVFGGVCLAQTATLTTAPSADSATKQPAPPAKMFHKDSDRAPAATASTASRDDLAEIRQAIANEYKEEQRRLDALQKQNEQLLLQLQQTQDKLTADEQEINKLEAEQQPQITQTQSDVTELKKDLSLTASDVQEEKKHQSEFEYPTSLRYRGVTITPGGFFAAEALYRGHAENADINTSWNSIPYDAQTMSHLSEFRATARQTRLSLFADGSTGSAKLTGYFETDFLGTGYGASEVQSNGYSNRVRQLWGRVALPGGWTFTGGQMWSLVTTNRLGIVNLSEYTTPLIDGSQFIGHDYARQTAFRLTKAFDADKITAAFSAENSATVSAIPANVPASIVSQLAGLSTTGTGALSNTTYSTNVAPDLIAKVAFDPGFGHYEIKALGRTFRDRLIGTSTIPGRNNTVLGGGIGAAAYLPVVRKKVEYIAEAMWGNIGRYGATSTDVVVKPNGDLSPEKSIHGITGIETHPWQRLDWYIYGSAEYLYRNYGYGAPGIDNTKCFSEVGFSCSASVKSLAGATTGIWYRFYAGSHGTVQYGAEYIYVYKDTWAGKGGSARGIDNMVETSFRYYLP